MKTSFPSVAIRSVAIGLGLLVSIAPRPAFADPRTDATSIYMPLLSEGVDVWRPVEAMKITDLGYMVTENPSPDEEWAFQPGHILRCDERQLSGRHA